MPELPPPQVWFRGPMLVLTRRDKVDSILIPDAHVANSLPGQPAAILKAHQIGMFIQRGDSGDCEEVDFRCGFNLLIEDGTPGAQANCIATCTNDYEGAVPLHRVVNTGAREALRPVGPCDDSVGAAVRFFGGKITPRVPCEGTYLIPGEGKPRMLDVTSVWAGQGGKVRITRLSRASGQSLTPIVLDPGDAAYVYNFDKDICDPGEFCASAGCGAANSGDEDFGWVYCLLGEPSNGWSNWLNGKVLGVPLHLCTQEDLERTEARIRAEAEYELDEAEVQPLPSPDDGDCLHAYFDLSA